MSIFQRLGAFLARLLKTKQGQEAVAAAVPAVEGAIGQAVSKSPIGAAVVATVVDPAIENAVSHIEQPKDPG